MMRLTIPSSSYCLSYSSLKASCESLSQADDLVDGGLELGLISSIKLVGELLVSERVTEVVSVGLETVLGGDTSSGSVILS